METETFSTKPQARLLLDHLAAIKDMRQSWKVAYPLREVLFLVVCGTIASDDDYDDIVDWGEAHLSFLRRFCEFHFGIPCADWLRTVMDRIDPDPFAACFSLGGRTLAGQARPGGDRWQDLAAQPRRQGGTKALHLVRRRHHPPTGAGSTGDRRKIQPKSPPSRR